MPLILKPKFNFFTPPVQSFTALALSLGVGSLALAGAAVGVAFTGPQPGTVAVSGTVPAIVIGIVPTLPVGTLALTGTAETLAFTIGPPVGSGALTGRLPALAFGVSPQLGVIVATGAAPTLAFQIPLPAGALSLTGQTPAVSTLSGIAVPAGTVAFTGTALTLAMRVALPAGVVVATGQTPTLTLGGILLPLPVGTLAVTGSAPALQYVAPIPAGALALTGRTPVLAGSVIVIPVPAGAAALTGQTPIRSRGGYETLVYVGGAEASGNSGTFALSLTALTGGIASSPSPGDLVIVSTGFVSTANGNPGVSTAGFTEVADLYADDTRDANFSVNYKIMGASPDASVSCNGSGLGTNGAVAVCQVWRGLDQTTPMDVTPTTATNINSSIPDSPSITPLTPNAVLIATGLGTSAAVDNTVTAPTGYSNQVDISVDPGNAVTVGIASKAWSGSGADDPAAWTNWTTSTSDSWGAVTLALRAAQIVEDFPVAVPVGALALSGNAPAVAFFGTAPGLVTLLGLAPTVQVNSPIVPVTIAMPAGSVAVSGYSAGVVGTGRVFDVPVGSLTVIGNYVGVRFLDPAAGVISLTGQAPTLAFGVAVPAGTLTLTGGNTIAARTFSIDVPVAVISLTSQAPTVSWTLPIGAGVVNAAGASPRLATHLLPLNASVDLIGRAPTLAFTSTTVTIQMPASGALFVGGAPTSATSGALPVGTATFAGAAPTLAFVHTFPASSLTVTGQAVAVNYPRALDVGALQAVGQAPTLGSVITIPAGAVSVTGLAETLSSRVDIPVGSLALTGLVAQVHLDQVVVIPAGAVTSAGVPLTILSPGGVSPDIGAVVIVGRQPSLALTIASPFGSVALAGTASTLIHALTPTAGSIAVVGQAPILRFTVAIGVGSVASVGTIVSPDRGLQPATGVVVVVGQGLSLAHRVAIPAGQLTIAADDQTIGFGRVDLVLGAATFTGYAPDRVVQSPLSATAPHVLTFSASTLADLPASYTPVILFPGART